VIYNPPVVPSIYYGYLYLTTKRHGLSNMDNATWWPHRVVPLGFSEPCGRREAKIADSKTNYYSGGW